MNLPVHDALSETYPQYLPGPVWHERIRVHHEKLSPIVQAHLDRASRQAAHPVMDFLFTYYPFSAAQLMRWSPGWGVRLQGDSFEIMQDIKEGVVTVEGWRLNPSAFPSHRVDALKWVLKLLENVAERPARFGCFGLHEWAMVYRAPKTRHAHVPLRYEPEKLVEIVDSMPINCSHYDAYRFFTESARPLNRIKPALETRQEMEQHGCLHVNMDLYKWGQQFYPWISSDVIADCFLLAVQIREVDMRASPYDLSGMNLEPIRIETEAGREEYVSHQQSFARMSEPLRARLIEAFRRLARAF